MTKIFLIFLLTVTMDAAAVAETKKAPKHILPIAHNNIEYRVPHTATQATGMKHNGGYIEMINKKTGARITLIEVYDNPKSAEAVYIKSIKIDGDNLVIEDENGKSYSLSVAKDGESKTP